jgi:hypothetical protein
MTPRQANQAFQIAIQHDPTGKGDFTDTDRRMLAALDAISASRRGPASTRERPPCVPLDTDPNRIQEQRIRS